MVGDTVVIKDGPFEGSEGAIIEINVKKGTLKITINLLGRDTAVEVNFSSAKIKK